MKKKDFWDKVKYIMKIPDKVKFVVKKLQEKGFEAFIVGGCVRDFLTKRKPQDWDVTTNAVPKEIGKIFSKSYLNNKFATVTVQTGSKKPSLKEIEVTTYRIDEKYTDKRHPDKIKFAKTLKEDLKRRDFTVNAMAMDLKGKVVDPFEGKKDLEKKTIRAVGDPKERFSEDALRMMRVARFATTLNFKIEKETAKAIKNNSLWLKAISNERIRDEFMKIIISKRAAWGIDLLRELGLLKHIIPELEKGYGVTQNKHHIYDCYEHAILSLKYAAKQKYNKYVRLAALLHDIGKPEVKEGEGNEATFYNHEIVGTKMTYQILNRLRFSKKDIEKVAKLVRYHLFYYNVDEVGESSVRKLVRNVGLENMDELIQVRKADRIGSGCPKAEPYKLRHLRYMTEKVSKDPISVEMLKVNGNDIMEILEISPGPKIGDILDILLGYVLEDPKKNKKSFLKKEIKKLGKINEKKLKAQSKKASKERKKIEQKKDEMTKKKYWVT